LTLTFVGLGLGAKGVSLEGVEAMRSAKTIYLEYYTTPHDPSLLGEIQKATGKEVTVVDREFVEDGKELLRRAVAEDVVLAVPGDPMVATTHNDLRVRATELGVATKLVHGVTAAAAVASASGLHYYKFGRTVTVTREGLGKMDQVYCMLHENLLLGAHTLLLLEYDVEGREGVAPAAAVEGLLRSERNFKRGVVSDQTLVLVICRVGRGDAKLEAGSFGEVSGRDYGAPPYSLVIPGRLHFTEVEAISAIFRMPSPKVHGNSEAVKRTAETLVPKYVAKTRKALESVKGKMDPRYGPVLENAELYLRDAEEHLMKGDDGLAMLSVGYAEGLLDSLSFAGVVKIDW
jgi:diphthine synthase